MRERFTIRARDRASRGAPVASTGAIHTAALAAGTIDLKRYAPLLLMERLTTVEEVTSVVALHE